MAGSSGSAQDFVNEMLPYAQQASAATGVDTQVILAQWANETGWGTSRAWTAQNNPAGIGWNGSTYYNYGSIQDGVQGWIDLINSSYKEVAQAGSPQAQAVALGNSPWAGGKYDAGGGPGTALIEIMQGPQVGGISNTPVATGADLSAMAAAIAADPTGQVKQYFQDLAAKNATQAPATPGPPPAAGQGSTDQNGAFSTVENALSQYGLGDLAQWAWGEITSGANSDQVLLDLQNQPAFQQRFPGLDLRKKNGLPAITPSQYLSYEDSAYQMARAAGLPTGFLSKDEIGLLIGNDVSTTEFNDRINKGYLAAINAEPNVRELMSQWFGSGMNVFQNMGANGAIAAYFLDPNRALPMLEAQLQSASIGADAKDSGFGDIGPYIAQLMQQQGITESEAKTGFKDLAKLTPLETPLPGNPNEPSVSQGQLIGFGFHGNDPEAVQLAEEARKAPFSGGGGFDTTAKGVVGAGSASTAGQQGT